MVWIDLKLEAVPAKDAMKRVEAEIYKYVVQHFKGNQSKTAIELGISRATLRTKLDEYFPGQFIGHRND